MISYQHPDRAARKAAAVSAAARAFGDSDWRYSGDSIVLTADNPVTLIRVGSAQVCAYCSSEVYVASNGQILSSRTGSDYCPKAEHHSYPVQP